MSPVFAVTRQLQLPLGFMKCHILLRGRKRPSLLSVSYKQDFSAFGNACPTAYVRRVGWSALPCRVRQALISLFSERDL